MKLVFEKRLIIPILMALFLLTSCDDGKSNSASKTNNNIMLTHEQWQSEIQQRFDILSNIASGAECLVFNQISAFPFQESKEYISASQLDIFSALVDAKLLTETIFVQSDPYYEDVIIYNYNLTLEGQKYYTLWPRLKQVGFCFGKVTVNHINSVEEQNGDIVIDYQYIIENVPLGIQQIFDNADTYINTQSLTRKVTFAYNNKDELFSKNGISLLIHPVR